MVTGLGSNGARLGPDGSKEGIISIERAPRLIHSTVYVQNVENLGWRATQQIYNLVRTALLILIFDDKLKLEGLL